MSVETTQNDNPQLPDNSFARCRVAQNKIKKHFITEDDKCNCNRCDMLHLLVWWDQSLIEKQEDFAILKDQSSCYVVKEGIFNIETCELAPPFIALQKYLGFNMLQAYYICDTFLKHADKAMVRDYATHNYGFGNMPNVAQDALNYILDDNILYVEDVALATLYGVLKDLFHISKSVIYEMIERQYIVVDSHYNICFLSYDEVGNVASVYKMSRYKHSDNTFSFNHYITRANVSFMYCSEEAKQYNSFGSVVVFDSPIELMSYLTLEESNHNIVPLMDESCCYIAMFNSNILSIKEWLGKHDEINTLYIAIRLTVLNSNYIKKHLIDYAKKLRVPKTQVLSDIILKHTQSVPTQYIYNSFRLDGWNALLCLYSNLFSVMF